MAYDTELQRLEALARILADNVTEVLSEYGALAPKTDRKVGFCLMCFTFDQRPGEGWSTYVSNAQRIDMIRAIDEFLQKLKTDPKTPGRTSDAPMRDSRHFEPWRAARIKELEDQLQELRDL